MPSRVGRRTVRGLSVGCALVASLAVSSPAVAATSQAVVDLAARANGRSAGQIRELLADRTARVHDSGRIYYVDPAPGAAPAAQRVASAPYPYGQTFDLHSRPGSSRVIYLDFDGETISGSAWNDSASYGTPASYYAEPFSLDATPDAFSDAEQDLIQSVWQRVAEDYAPFDVDVTTQDPGLAAIDRAGASDMSFGTRALITDAPEVGSTCSCGGVAYLGVFDAASQHQKYQPALVFPENLGNGAKAIAEAATHEVGHNFSLSHDGTASVGYFTGQGSWAPIMGVGYAKPIVQWSKGEYAGANNAEDDLAKIAARGAPLLADDAGDTTAAALDAGSGPSLSRAGVITTDADIDVIKISAGAGAATFTVTPAPNSPDLDAQLKLLNSGGTVLATSNPASATSTSDVATGMGASISTSLPSQGTYYLAVDGVGALDPASTGYSGYASLGRYTLSGTFTAGGGTPPPAGPPNDAFASPTPLSGAAGTISATNVNATAQAGEPSHAGVAGGKSVWYSWTAPATASVTIETTASAFDTLLGVYTGSAVDALTVRASNDDSGGAQSKVTFAATAGTVYRIAVDGKAGAAGALTLRWAQQAGPANDAFANAISLTGQSGAISASSVNATKESGEPTHGSGSAKSIWFAWTAPKSGTLTLDTIGSSFDTLLAVYTGSAINALTKRASNDDISGANLQSRVVMAVTNATTYRFAVDGYNAASGAVTLHWSLP